MKHGAIKMYGGMNILLHHSLPQLEREISTQLHDTVSLNPVDIAHRNPLDRRLDWLQSRSGRYGVEKNVLLLPEIEPQLSVARRYKD
jgi:hypothetical protein